MITEQILDFDALHQVLEARQKWRQAQAAGDGEQEALESYYFALSWFWEGVGDTCRTPREDY